MDRRHVERSCLGEQRVDAAGAEALEVVASERQRVEHLSERGLRGRHFVCREHALDDAVPVDVERADDIVDTCGRSIEVRHDGRDATAP